MIDILLLYMLMCFVIGVGTWLGYQLVQQNGRILLRLDAVEKRLEARGGGEPRDAGGLPLGTVAPAFELPDLNGVQHKFSAFRGKSVLLIFFDPLCGFCAKMAAELADLPADGGDDCAIPVVVTTGDQEANTRFVAQYKIRCLVLRQEAMEVAAQFHVQGTPMGYRIDKAGRIASELSVGAEPLLKLAEATAAGCGQTRARTGGSPPAGVKDQESLARSRLNRKGLKAGVPAPDFRLPRIDGGELSLADLRGRRVLLVFSDPHCGPCDELAPRLEQIHSQRSDLEVLVVSRGDVEANRAKAAANELHFPIVLQRKWEVSLHYAMFATPIGYLIDEQGVIVRDVAVGVGPILALADEPIGESGNDDALLLAGKEVIGAS